MPSTSQPQCEMTIEVSDRIELVPAAETEGTVDDLDAIQMVSDEQFAALEAAQFDVLPYLERINLSRILRESRAIALDEADVVVTSLYAIGNDILSVVKDEDILNVVRKSHEIKAFLEEHLTEPELGLFQRLWTRAMNPEPDENGDVAAPVDIVAAILFEKSMLSDAEGNPFCLMAKELLYSNEELNSITNVGPIIAERRDELSRRINSSEKLTTEEVAMFDTWIYRVALTMAKEVYRLTDPEKFADSLKTIFQSVEADGQNFDDICYMYVDVYYRVLMRHQKALQEIFEVEDWKEYDDCLELFKDLYQSFRTTSLV